MKFWSAVLVVAAIAAGGCDRRVEPFVPGEKAQAPDLTKIFPAGADRSAEPAAGMPSAGGRGAAPVEESGAPIDGRIELAPELVGHVPPNAVVFVMARREDAGPLVAAQRIADPRFPLDFSLGSEHRMGAEIPFAGPMHISVRVDADGNATTRNVGDLLGSSAEAHEPGDRGVVVLVSEVQIADSAAGASPAMTTGATSEAIEGMLELAPDLAGRVPPGAVLFVIARTAPSGPPLAVVRVATPTFPVKFSIGPEDRMIQSMPFAGEIRISARVDADGNAMTRDPGDLHGAVESPNAPGDRGVALLIDEVL
jgi:hypothetical protein